MSADIVQPMLGQANAVRRARLVVTLLFGHFGICIGMWAAHIPVIQTRLGLDPAMLGLALLASAFGTILAQPLLGVLIARTGARPATIVFPPLSALILAAVMASPTIVTLFIFCFCVGAAWGGMNVAINTMASEIETLRGRPTMSSFHAGASIGMLVGSALGGLLVGAGLGNGMGAAGVAALLFIASLLTIPHLLPSAPKESGPAFMLPNRAVLGLGALAFLMFLVEGGMVDWSGVFLATDKGAEAGLAAAGFAAFTAAMAVCRVLGNGIVERLGRKRVVAGGGVLIVIGVLTAVLSPWLPLCILGFVIIGIGASNIVPILISAAAQTPGMAPSVAIGSVSTMLTAGFLVGPPLIGFVSHATSLSLGLSLLTISGLAVAIAGFARSWPK